ncbi:GNAT family N-acetyltransferase [Dokdonella sp.]|uniref:GNAT family N-acetyltransferase n=1 Tax=Dokdonella sp. TaxID=2291710 RepID=UPI0031C8CDA7|nr:GNAT family N-acetyltransferase [Dokdonella sp.]
MGNRSPGEPPAATAAAPVIGTGRSLRIESLAGHDVPAAAALLAASMRDNPLHRRVFGHDDARLQPLLAGAFEALLRLRRDDGRVLVARNGAGIVGVVAMAPPGRCQPGLRFRLHMLGLLARHGALGVAPRIARWLAVWKRNEPKIPHWHLGPAAVERSRQGQGVGTQLMTAVCAELDRVGGAGYLETDKEANVRLYARGGFRVIAQREVLGIHNWFMLRPPPARPPERA